MECPVFSFFLSCSTVTVCNEWIDWLCYEIQSCNSSIIGQKWLSIFYFIFVCFNCCFLWFCRHHWFPPSIHLRLLNWAWYSSLALRSISGSTRPLWGSVPRGRRKRRIWGSGLYILSNIHTYIHAHKWKAKVIRMSNAQFVGSATLQRRLDDSTRLTCEWHNVAILDFVGRRCLAIPIPTRDGSWGGSWQAPSVVWHDCR